MPMPMPPPLTHSCHCCTLNTVSSPVFSVCRDEFHFQTAPNPCGILQTDRHARSDSSNSAEFTAVPAGTNFLSSRYFINFCWLFNESSSNYVIFSWWFTLPLDTGHAPNANGFRPNTAKPLVDCSVSTLHITLQFVPHREHSLHPLQK
jgi:hypothetical protein